MWNDLCWYNTNLSINFDDILRIINRFGHDCIFEDAKSVTIFYTEKGVMVVAPKLNLVLDV